MESTAKEEDTALIVVDTANTSTITATGAENPIAVTNIIVPEKEVIMTTDVEHVVCESAVISDKSAITVNTTSNSPTAEEDLLNIAMASTTISTNYVDEIKPNQGEAVLDEQQKSVTTIVKKEIVIADNSDINKDISLKTESEPDDIINSTIVSRYEDAVEYINDEEDNVVEEQPQDVVQQKNVPDDESISQQEDRGNSEEDSDEDSKDPDASTEPVVPVPVDDDTNDPQYIPRRGRFYEHDDRMAYSTTSSEGSESDNGYEEDSGDDNEEMSEHRRIRRRHTGIKKQKSIITEDVAENTAVEVEDGTPSNKKVLAISKVAATIKDSVTADGLEKKLGVGARKSRNLDALDKWSHDLYDENEQTRKSRDELLASYGYDIREESEAPRARRHHKYGRAATTKYTRNWQDTKAYNGAASGPQSMKVKRGSMARRSIGSNKNKSKTDDYSSEFPALDDTKKSEPKSSTESPTVVEASDQNHVQHQSSFSVQNQEQQQSSFSVQNQEKKVVAVSETSQSWQHIPSSRETTKYNTSSPSNRNNRQDQQNGGPLTTNNKNYFHRPLTESQISKENVELNRDSSSASTNYFNRRPQQNSSGHNQYHNYKQQHNSGQGGQGHNQHHQHSLSSAPRGRNFHQHHTSQQFNRDRYFSKGSTSPSSSSSNQHNYDQHRQSVAPTSAGTGRTQHGGGHYQHYNNRQYENDNQQIEQPALPTPVVRSSKRYSVQSRRELPDPVLNFNRISKTPQPLPPSVQQQNGLVMQDQQIQSQQQMQPVPQQLQQQQPIQIHQQPQPLQIQQYHQPLQQIHTHHGMVVDHNTGMMVMAAPDPSLYHPIYATPQYSTGVSQGPTTGNADDPNAAAVAAAAALQMLAAQAAVYQPVPTGATGVTSPPSGTQSLQQPETFMTTYYQPQQQPQQQPPPRRVNLAIPIVAPPPEPNQQQGNSKTNLSTTPPPTTASTN